MKPLLTGEDFQLYSPEALLGKKADEKIFLDPAKLPEDWDQYCEDGYKHVVKIKLFKEYWKTMESLLIAQSGAVVLGGQHLRSLCR